MIRAGAKNHDGVTVVVDPADYALVIDEMDEHGGATTRALRKALAARAFARTAAYDAAISGVVCRPARRDGAEDARDRRPARRGAPLWREPASIGGVLPHGRAALRRRHRHAGARQGALLQQSQRYRRGLRAGRRVRSQARTPPSPSSSTPILAASPSAPRSPRHTRKALACDPVSAFGGIVALNRKLDAEAAREIVKIFTEVIIAPDASDEAKAIIAEKKNLRLLLAGGLPDPKA